MILIALLFTVGIVIADEEADDPKSGEEINWQVISSGGTDGTSDSYGLLGTAGQIAVGAGASDNYGLSHGYWQQTGTGGTGCCVFRGDVNHDGTAVPDIADLVYLVTYMFQDGPTPICDEPGASGCPEHYYAETDVNGDGTCIPDIADLVYLVTFMFQDGPALVPC